MMESAIDVRTLIQVVTLELICRALLLGYLCKLDRFYIPARYWALGSAGMALGALLIGLRDFIPESLSILLAQCVLILGWMTVSGGTLIAMGRRVPWGYGFLLTIIAMAGVYWFLMESPNFPSRTLISSSPVILFDLYVAVIGLLQHSERKSQVIKLIALLALIQGLSRTVYALHIFTTDSQTLLDPHWSAVQFLLVMAASVLVWTVLFFLMALQTTVLNILNVSKDGFWINDLQGRFTEVNAAYCQMIGYSRKELLSMRIADVEAIENPAETAARMKKVLQTGSDFFETQHRCRDGSVIDIEVTVDYSPANGGLCYVFLRNISDRKAQELDLNRYKAIVESTDDAIIGKRLDGVITSWNAAAERIFGYTKEEALGKPMQILIPEDRADEESQILAQISQGQKVESFETVRRCKDGHLVDISTTISPIIDRNGNVVGASKIARDISIRKRYEAEIERLAFFDPLTRLPNRRMLFDRLRLAMSGSKRSRKYGALMLFDLDNFKPANDQYGHDVGDQILMEVALRTSKVIRETDTVARVGGDEFIVLINELNSDEGESTREALNIAEKIRITLSRPYELTTRNAGQAVHAVQHHCTASLGLTLFLGDTMTQDEIIKRADSEMYKAKALGRNKVLASVNGP